MNNRLHIDTKILVRSMIRQLSMCLEVANKIDDKESRLIVAKITVQEKNVKRVVENISRGNVWLTLYYLREILEAVLLTDDW